MATWGDHPESSRGQLFILRPRLKKAMLVNEASGVVYPAGDIDFDTELGATTWDKRDTFCTASFGTSAWFPTGDFRNFFNRGVAPVFEIDEASNILTLTNVPNGIRPGEINPANNDKIFIWDDFRPWALPPLFFNLGGTYMLPVRKGGIGSSNTMRGVAHNIGSAGVFTRAGAGGYVDVDFVLDQVSPRVDAPLGSGTLINWANPAYVLTASSENGANVAANMKDNNPATYWESTGGTNEWIKVDLSVSNTDALSNAAIEIYTATSFPNAIQVDGSNNDTDWTPVHYAKLTATVPTGSYYYLLVDNDRNFPVYRYYRFTFAATQGAGTFTIARLAISKSDEASTDPDWDIGTGPSYQTGSTSTPSITVRYPPGFYWIKAGDWGLTGYWKLARRPVCILDYEEKYATNYGSTATASGYTGGLTPARAFDKDLTEFQGWGYTVVPAWLNIEYPSERYFTGFRIMAGWNDTIRPKSIQIQFKNEMTGGYSAIYTSTDLGIADDSTWYEFEFTQPVWAKTFRLQVNSVNSGTSVFVRELEYIHELPYGFTQKRVTVESHRMGIDGQEMTFRVRDDISQYPPGTLVMYREDESYQGVQGSLSAADPTGSDREGIVFVGWIDERRTDVKATKKGKVDYTDIVCYDIAGWAKRLPFTSALYRNLGSIGSAEVFSSFEMGWLPGLHIDSIIFHILFDFSTLLELADFYHSETWFNYRCPARDVSASSIFNAADGVAQTIAHRLTCNKMGQFKVLPDANLQQSGDRTATVQESIADADIIRWSNKRTYTGRVGRHWGSAIIVDETRFDELTSGMGVVFCIAPDPDAWSQGLDQIEVGEQLVIDQTELNNREGQRYSIRSNVEFSIIRLELAHGNDAGIDPARMEPIQLTITDVGKGPDGWVCTDQRCYPVSMTIERDHKANTKKVVLMVELEVDGVAANTYTPPT